MNFHSATYADLVVLVHGFAAVRIVMWPLEYRLRAAGFDVHPWIYRSLFSPIDIHAARLFVFLATEIPAERRFHIVAHSMGCIVVRAALARGELPNLGRIALLAPPNAGSPVARLASRCVDRWITPAVELSDAAGSYVNRLPGRCDAETAIFAGRWDALVPVPSTHLPGEAVHVTLNATHNSLLLSRRVGEMVAVFLRTGRVDVYENTEVQRVQRKDK